MKRELAALALLILLAALLLWNIRTLDELVGELESHVCRSSAALARGDREHAVSELETALSRWDASKDYAHIFIRSDEIDAVSDAFFELSAAVRGNGEQQKEAYLKLLYHLDSIGEMEHLRPGSIF